MTKPTAASVPDFKIRVLSEAHSRAIQEELFRRGVKWCSGYEGVQNYREDYLYVLDGGIVFGNMDSVFLEDESEEHTFTNGKFSFDEEEAKPDADGWIEWDGGECPVKDGVNFDIKFRNGLVYEDLCGLSLRWDHTGSGGDIIAYRIHRPKSDNKSVLVETEYGVCINADYLQVIGPETLNYRSGLQSKKEWRKDRLMDVLKEMTRLVAQADYDTVYDLLTDEAAQLINDLKWK
jgi:hypothetical protein